MIQNQLQIEAEIISIGTELLLGQTINTDATIIARELASVGIDLHFVQTVGDNPDRLKKALEIALSRSQIIITTGGLGPTDDDLSKNVVATVTGKPLTLDNRSFGKLKEMHTQREMEEIQKRQAFFPENSVILENTIGTAPGCAVQIGQYQWICMLPGPPHELKPMLEKSLIPLFKEKFPLGVLYSKKLRVFGLTEAKVAQILGTLLNNQNPTTATYAANGEVMVRVTAKADSLPKAKDMMAPIIREIAKRLGSFLYSADVECLEDLVVAELRRRKLKLAVAESCTGGLVAKRITDQPGASEIFGFGFVTYANEAKMELLDVPADILQKYGAVSQETAKLMAQGARKAGHADLAIAITGIAGPDGGTPTKPVGLIYIALADGKDTYLRCLKPNKYFHTRTINRQRAANHALDMLRRYLLKLPIAELWPV